VRSIPYVGIRALSRIGARTTLIRAVLAIALIALVLAAAAAARHPQPTAKPFLAPDARGMVVLDLSASISSDVQSRIGTTLSKLVAQGGSYGLVVFSGSAYEALPPGTPASVLQPMIRYFTLGKTQVPGEAAVFPTNPWTNSFTNATEISQGLDLARRILAAGKVAHPSVVLISDLQDDSNDQTKLSTVLNDYRHDGIRTSLVTLNAAPGDERYFLRELGSATKLLPASLPGKHPISTPRTSLATWLEIFTAIVAVLLAVNELRAARLRWGTSAAEEVTAR
jgi:hypothetical protein